MCTPKNWNGAIGHIYAIFKKYLAMSILHNFRVCLLIWWCELSLPNYAQFQNKLEFLGPIITPKKISQKCLPKLTNLDHDSLKNWWKPNYAIPFPATARPILSISQQPVATSAESARSPCLRRACSIESLNHNHHAPFAGKEAQKFLSLARSRKRDRKLTHLYLLLKDTCRGL